MSDLRTRPGGHHATFALALCAALALASALPLTAASCRTQAPRADEPAAFERLRMLTRGGTLPPEPLVAQLASDYAGTRTGALAGLLRARIRFEAHDYLGASTLLRSAMPLRSDDFSKYTKVGDYALWLRADALEKMGSRAEARAALEQLARDHPDSLRARDATIHAAQLLAQDGQAAGVPAEVKTLAAADDPEALLLTAKAYEQTGEQLKALAAYRRLYFHAPGANDAEAVAAFARLGSTTAPATAEALDYLAQHYTRARQWDAARSTLEEMRRAFPKSEWTMRALVAAGQAAKDAKNQGDALNFDRLAVQLFPGEPEVAGAQFETAWAAHDAKNFAESSRLLVEHLATYADRNTDNRGKAGYSAARDAARSGHLAEARTLYEAMLNRY